MGLDLGLVSGSPSSDGGGEGAHGGAGAGPGRRAAPPPTLVPLERWSIAWGMGGAVGPGGPSQGSLARAHSGSGGSSVGAGGRGAVDEAALYKRLVGGGRGPMRGCCPCGR